jgi:hypothetical protein
MTHIPEDDKHLRFVPLATLTTPPSGLIEHLPDRWWLIHPVHGAVFWHERHVSAAQCNRDERIAVSIRDRMYPWAQVGFIKSAFRRIDPHDYI